MYESYQDDPRGSVMILAVVIDDNGGNTADARDAELYADGKGFTFPAVPDSNGLIQRYFAIPAFPFNMFIDARTMTIDRIVHNGLDTSDLEGHFERILNME